MKRLLLTLVTLASTFTVSASHLIGGDLSYQYVSTTGATSTYKVLLTLYNDPTGASMPTTNTVTVTGGGATFSVQVSLVKPGYSVANVGGGLCSNGAALVQVHEYAGTATFNSSANYTFS